MGILNWTLVVGTSQDDETHCYCLFCCCGFAAPEADAEADPAHLYGSHGYIPSYSNLGAYGAYPHSGYGYSNLGFSRAAYGAYTYRAYGKRSANAEPKADAEADAYYRYNRLPAFSTYGAHSAYPHSGYGYSNLGFSRAAYGAYPNRAYGKRSADAEPKADAEADAY